MLNAAFPLHSDHLRKFWIAPALMRPARHYKITCPERLLLACPTTRHPSRAPPACRVKAKLLRGPSSAGPSPTISCHSARTWPHPDPQPGRGSPLPPGNAVSASPGAVCPLYPSLVPTAQICGQILTRGPGTGHELEQRMPWKRCPRKNKRRGRSGPKEKGRERESRVAREPKAEDI